MSCPGTDRPTRGEAVSEFVTEYVVRWEEHYPNLGHYGGSR